jgi:MFS family permease
MISYIFVPVLAQSIGANMIEIGIIGATYFIVTTPMMYILGRLSDYQDLRRRIIFFGFLIATFVYFLLSISNSTLQLIILMALLGVSTSAYLPSMLALVSEEASKIKTGLKMGFYTGSISAGYGVGGISGGLIGDILGLSAVFLFCGVVLALSTVVVFLILKNMGTKKERYDSSKSKRRKKDLSLKIPLSFKEITNSQFVMTGMLALFIAVFLRNLGYRGLTNFLSLYLLDLGASKSLMGMIISLNFILQFFLMPSAGWISDRLGRKITISAGMIGSSVAMFLYSTILNPYEAIPIQFLVALSWSMILASAYAYVADFAPKNRRGGSMGLLRTSQDLGGAIGPPIAGVLVDTYDYRVMIQFLMGIPLLGAIISYFKLKK